MTQSLFRIQCADGVFFRRSLEAALLLVACNGYDHHRVVLERCTWPTEAAVLDLLNGVPSTYFEVLERFDLLYVYQGEDQVLIARPRAS